MTKLDVRPQRARPRLGGARVLARKLRVEPFPTCRMRGLCDECQSRCGATPFEPRPVGTVPEWSRLSGTHSRPGQSRQRKRVARRRRLRRGRCEAEMARPPPCFLTGQGGACSRSARNRRFPPPPPAGAATGGRQPLRGWQARVCGAHEPSLNHTPPAPVLHQVQVKRSYQPGGQGRRADWRGQGRLFLAGDPLPTHLPNGLHPIQAPNMVGLRVSRGTH